MFWVIKEDIIMIESFETKVNYIIILDDEKYEIFIRGESNIKEKGIKICFEEIDNINNFINKIKNFKLDEVIKYLKDNSIKYKLVRFV